MTTSMSRPWWRPNPTEAVPWLGGLTPRQFMRTYWQKKPLLVRNAFPADFAPIGIDEILGLCADDHVQARLVRATGAHWTLDHGPFTRRQLPRLSAARWTVLVQQVNTCLPQADRFLDAFRFIPEARLDDLMVSVAGPDGGIGAHVDSYDVFLVQAAGQRRWEIAQTFDHDLIADVPLKILKRFRAEQDWVLGPGDLLYLPPQVAHRGTAVGTHCMTWSVGFRAPNRLSLADAVWSQHLDTLVDADWRDPWLGATARPGEIPARLLKALTQQVHTQLPSKAVIAKAVAQVLSEPAPQAIFDAPKPCHSRRQFAAAAARSGLRLASATRLLYCDDRFFMNGEPVTLGRTRGAGKALRTLADARALLPKDCGNTALDVLYDMYRSGWIVYD